MPECRWCSWASSVYPMCVQWGWVLAGEVLVLLALVWGSLSLREQLPLTTPSCSPWTQILPELPAMQNYLQVCALYYFVQRCSVLFFLYVGVNLHLILENSIGIGALCQIKGPPAENLIQKNSPWYVHREGGLGSIQGT